MKKFALATLVFFITFSFSFLFVNFLTKKVYEQTIGLQIREAAQSKKLTFETEQQTRIKNFLEKDQSFVSARSNYSGIEGRRKFFSEVVIDMKNLAKDSDLPLEIRVAYQDNIDAWSDYSRHLENSENHSFADDDKECKRINERLNITFKKLLDTAKQFDVNFKP